ncbi:Cell division protein FtsL [Corynebacterium capitovis DSM 44611]|uniref:FtsB family cell division protein n=1 Tax=Corynebacterium capitovis TaxID=131081 RepID=UPI0012EA5860|nr:septum formation initiator family protein [Corynebacterium capitovis]WKD57272.1 Cell division protein FtsL [Corynebacterium capitovis DSM 44611]
MSTLASEPGPERKPGRRTDRRPRRPVTRVPVASRDRERAEAKKNRKRRVPFEGDIVSLTIVMAVVLAVLLAVAVPLRNYYEGRSEIARLNDSIAALEDRKAALESDIAKYQDPEYVKQEARRRLGMIEPGETAWRVIDPRMTTDSSFTADDAPDTRSWVQVMWDSLREVE